MRHFIAARAGIYAQLSYSQEGEDLILERMFEGQESGFYVDVGALHPRRFSNTCRFYERGWRGINIEPNPDGLVLFRRQRKRDINLEYGVADHDGELVYTMFNEPALNTFDKALADQRPSDRYHIVGTKKIAVRRLASILEESMPASTRIDFMSIDVEGYDLDVLKSNDWSKFRPACVLVEVVGFNLANSGEEPVHAFLAARNYELFAKTVNTLIYRDKTS